MVQIPFEYLLNTANKEIPIFDAIILYLIYKKEDKSYQDYVESQIVTDYKVTSFLQYWEKQGLLKIVGDSLPNDVEFRENFVSLIPQSEKSESTWITEWINLWPSGVKSGSYYVKSSEKDVLPKMQKFIKKYKFPQEIIMEATKKYLAERKAQNWIYTTCADYFIIKNDVSRLASYCANYAVKEPNKTNFTQTL